MASLDVRIPPPLVAVAVAVAMWVASRFAPWFRLPDLWRLVAVAAMLLAGIGFSAGGVLAFRRAQTTLDPTRPERASQLVRSGVYGVTRNPMYVGLAWVLVAWAVSLSSAWALLGPIAFVLYIGRFQIAPEEHALLKVFGQEYEDYRAKVRRWL